MISFNLNQGLHVSPFHPQSDRKKVTDVEILGCTFGLIMSSADLREGKRKLFWAVEHVWRRRYKEYKQKNSQLSPD